MRMPYKNPEDKKAWRKLYAPKQLQQSKSWRSRTYPRKDPVLILKRIEDNKAKKQAAREAVALRKKASENSKPVEIQGINRRDFTPAQECIWQRWSHRNRKPRYPLTEEQKVKAYATNKTRLALLKHDSAWMAKERRRQRDFNKSSVQRVLYQRLVGRISKCARRNKGDKSTLDLLGCSAIQFKAWLEAQFTKGMSWDNYGKWHIDHKVQCNRFDLSDPQQMSACFHYSNLRPLWGVDNLKRTKKSDTVQSMLMLGAEDLAPMLVSNTNGSD